MKIIHVPSRREENHQKTGENLKEEKSPLKNSRYPQEEKRPLKKRRVWMKSGSRHQNKDPRRQRVLMAAAAQKTKWQRTFGLMQEVNKKWKIH